MTDLIEPADRGYATVKLDDGGFELLRRRDDWAERYDRGDARWFNGNSPAAPSLTWEEVTRLGQVMYPGKPLNRKVA